MSTGKLIIHSCKRKPSISSIESFTSALKEIQLIGETIENSSSTFLTGENFLQLISFIGCSTNVCLTPGHSNGGDFCHITIKGSLDKPTIIWDSNCRPPRCPACKKPMHNWQQHLNIKKLKCSECSNESQLEDISWGRQGGFGHIFIKIHNIFPGEARPTQILLNNLSRATETEWNYFYTESEKTTL
jgi:hypothetical protein